MRNKFKDACDKCGLFDYCVGFDDIILCQKCYKDALNKDEMKHHSIDKIEKKVKKKVDKSNDRTKRI